MKYDSVAIIGAVLLLIRCGIGRVERCVYVGGQAFAFAQHAIALVAVRFREIVDEIA